MTEHHPLARPDADVRVDDLLEVSDDPVVAADDAVPVLPAGGLLLHIGPFKTGTTAIQDALSGSVDVLREHGVVYPGTGRRHHRAVLSALERRYGWKDRGGRQAPAGDWPRLLSHVAAAGDARVVVSSEYFCLADLDRARSIVADLGREPVHVVVTARNLGRLLPSHWQQSLKGGSGGPFEPWLREHLATDPDDAANESFWRRNDLGALVDRWIEVVGVDRVVVVVPDERRPERLFHAFEDLLALPHDSLLRPPGGRSNRSLSAAEAEALRGANAEVTRRGLPWADYEAVLREGAVARMLSEREPAADEPALVMPEWSLDRVAELGAAAAVRIRRSGVAVVGDLDLLVERLPVRPGPGDDLRLPVEAVSELLLGALSGSMRRGADFGEQVTPWPPAPSQRPVALTKAYARDMTGSAARAATRARRRAAEVIRRGSRPARP